MNTEVSPAPVQEERGVLRLTQAELDSLRSWEPHDTVSRSNVATFCHAASELERLYALEDMIPSRPATDAAAVDALMAARKAEQEALLAYTQNPKDIDLHADWRRAMDNLIAARKVAFNDRQCVEAMRAHQAARKGVI